MMKVKLYLLSSRNLFFILSPEDELFLQFESLRSKNKFLEDNKYNFTFIMDQPRSETVFNNSILSFTFINKLKGSVNCGSPMVYLIAGLIAHQ